MMVVLPAPFAAQQAVDFAIANLQADVVDGGEAAELLDQAGPADGDVTAQAAVILGCRKLTVVELSPSARSLATKTFSRVGLSTRISSTSTPAACNP